MSGPWLAAIATLCLLLVAVTIVLARLLRVVASLDRSSASLRERVRRLETVAPEPGHSHRAAPATPSPRVVHVTLEPGCVTCRELALDLQVTGLDRVPLPVRILVEDGPAGRELVAHLPMPVEFEQTVGTAATGVPHAFVVNEEGAVLAKGDPATVAELVEMART